MSKVVCFSPAHSLYSRTCVLVGIFRFDRFRKQGPPRGRRAPAGGWGGRGRARPGTMHARTRLGPSHAPSLSPRPSPVGWLHGLVVGCSERPHGRGRGAARGRRQHGPARGGTASRMLTRASVSALLTDPVSPSPLLLLVEWHHCRDGGCSVRPHGGRRGAARGRRQHGHAEQGIFSVFDDSLGFLRYSPSLSPTGWHHCLDAG